MPEVPQTGNESRASGGPRGGGAREGGAAGPDLIITHTHRDPCFVYVCHWAKLKGIFGDRSSKVIAFPDVNLHLTCGNMVTRITRMYPALPLGPAHSAVPPGDQGRDRCLKVSLPLITSWIPQEEQEGEQEEEEEEEGAGPRTPVTH